MAGYIQHVRSEKINAQNVWTLCERVVSPCMAKLDRSKSDCVECLDNTHANLSFEQTRDKSILKRKRNTHDEINAAITTKRVRRSRARVVA